MNFFVTLVLLHAILFFLPAMAVPLPGTGKPSPEAIAKARKKYNNPDPDHHGWPGTEYFESGRRKVPDALKDGGPLFGELFGPCNEKKKYSPEEIAEARKQYNNRDPDHHGWLPWTEYLESGKRKLPDALKDDGPLFCELRTSIREVLRQIWEKMFPPPKDPEVVKAQKLAKFNMKKGKLQRKGQIEDAKFWKYSHGTSGQYKDRQAG